MKTAPPPVLSMLHLNKVITQDTDAAPYHHDNETTNSTQYSGVGKTRAGAGEATGLWLKMYFPTRRPWICVDVNSSWGKFVPLFWIVLLHIFWQAYQPQTHTSRGSVVFFKGEKRRGGILSLRKKKKETKSTHSISNVQESLHTFCAGESICALQASKVLPVWPAPVFLSQWFQPHGPTVFFILVPEETRNSLPTAVLSCALSATAAVM